MGGNGIPHPVFPSSAFIWHNGETIALPLPAHAAENTGVATSINNRGDACGYYFVDDPNGKGYFKRGCAWIDGEFIDLGVLPGADESHPLDINDAREIVGRCEGFKQFARAFLWRDGVMTDLMHLLPPGVLLRAEGVALNNSGQIAGGGNNLDGDGVAIRLTPALPAIPGNTNCDGAVDADDLINVILGWNPDGPVGGRTADVNRDNQIDFDDLWAVIVGWTG
jgi:probable HAF family extracellular repeat protein